MNGGGTEAGEEEGDLSSAEHEDAIADRIRTRRANTSRPRGTKQNPVVDLSEEEEDESDPDSPSPPRPTGGRPAGRPAQRARTTKTTGSTRGRANKDRPSGTVPPFFFFDRYWGHNQL